MVHPLPLPFPFLLPVPVLALVPVPLTPTLKVTRLIMQVVQYPTAKGKIGKRLELCRYHGTRGEFITEMLAKYREFLLHQHIARWQAEQLALLRLKLVMLKAIVGTLDFSEDYTSKPAVEIPSDYRISKGVAILPALMEHRVPLTPEEGVDAEEFFTQQAAYFFIADDKKKDPNVVKYAMERIMRDAAEAGVDYDDFFLSSDGCVLLLL